MLPYIEEKAIAAQFDSSQSWHSAANGPAISNPIKIFTCPTTPEADRHDTTYVKGAAAGDYGSVNGVKKKFWQYFPQLGPYNVESRPPYVGVLNKYLDGNSVNIPACKIKNITDGTSQTIMVAEDAGRPYFYQQGKAMLNPPPARRMLPMAADGPIPTTVTV